MMLSAWITVVIQIFITFSSHDDDLKEKKKSYIEKFRFGHSSSSSSDISIVTHSNDCISREPPRQRKASQTPLKKER